MTPEEKLKILGASAKYDVSCCGGSQREVHNIPGIYYASGSNSKVIPILKTLFTNHCRNDCFYCVNRISRDAPRVSFTPDELANLFMEIYHKRFVDGLFLSSGVAGSANQTMQKMIDTAILLRYKHHFGGYIHLKILPGSHSSNISRAMQVANRVSVNIETPTPAHLAKITTGKDFQRDILDSMEIIKDEIQRKGGGVDQTTQFVVGASNETDQEIITTMSWLRNHKGLHRIYFSAFAPVDYDLTPAKTTELLLRKNRLYQTEFLLRLYGFSLSEIYFNQSGRLPGHLDPKMNFAMHNPGRFPVEINRASFHQLIRIPGIGKITARRIMAARQQGRLTSLVEVRKLGAITKHAAPFILINGRKQGELKDLVFAEQLALL